MNRAPFGASTRGQDFQEFIDRCRRALHVASATPALTA